MVDVPSREQLHSLLEGNTLLAGLMDQLVQTIMDNKSQIQVLAHENSKLKNMMANLTVIDNTCILPADDPQKISTSDLTQIKLSKEKILTPIASKTLTPVGTRSFVTPFQSISKRRSISNSRAQTGLSTTKILTPRRIDARYSQQFKADLRTAQETN
jgi:hypothetical protein